MRKNSKEQSNKMEYNKTRSYLIKCAVLKSQLGSRSWGNGRSKVSKNHAVVNDVALCNFKPSYAWSHRDYKEVTCPTCLSRIQKKQRLT